MQEENKDSPSGFVWAGANGGSVLNFFGGLIKNGGKYVVDDPKARKILCSFDVGDNTLFQTLRKIFKDTIPVDCALYAQVILQKDYKNTTAFFGIGLYADIILGQCNSELQALYFQPEDSNIASALMTTTCDSKGHWVVRSRDDRMIGMTPNGPVAKSAEDWSTYLTKEVTTWLDVHSTSVQDIDDNIARCTVLIILRDTGSALKFTSRPAFAVLNCSDTICF